MNIQSQQPDLIKSMFSQVASRYDAANNILSFGIHHLWRRKLVRLSGATAGMSILDCATGTGDLAIEFKKAVGPTGKVLGTDFCVEMLNFAPAKARSKNFQIEFEVGDVMSLKYLSESFDVSSISFGIRNVSNPVQGLTEMARVTKSGGKVMVLEFGQMQLPVVSAVYDYYSQNILPRIGGWVTGKHDAYQYLQKSSAQFPCRERFIDLMKQTGLLKNTGYVPVSGGIAYIYFAERI